MGSLSHRGPDGPANQKCLPPAALVVDDHAIVREGLSLVLEKARAARIVGSAATGEQAIDCARRLQPDLVLMDMALPDMTGIDATRRILAHSPHIAILVVSALECAEEVFRVMRAGARGYVHKTAACAELAGAVRAVHAGETYVCTSLSGACSEAARRSTSVSALDRLSERERQVLQRVIRGASSADIADELALSRKTVDTYRSRLMVKLDVTDRTGLIKYMALRGLA
jgi:DNA-binding NarL/FixJ family response regulator